LKFEGGFHGVHDYAIQGVCPNTPYPSTPPPESAGIPAAATESVLIAPFNDVETTAALIDAHHRDLAAVIVEPFPPSIPPLPGFPSFLRKGCSLSGAVTGQTTGTDGYFFPLLGRAASRQPGILFEQG